jgi:hypothetical protein
MSAALDGEASASRAMLRRVAVASCIGTTVSEVKNSIPRHLQCSARHVLLQQIK